MSCGEEIDKWKVDLAGKFFGVDAGRKGLGDDEGGVGGVGEEKVAVRKPKIVVEKKVVVDTFYDYLASPGECVIIPDVAEKTWTEVTNEELGQELADKLKEDKIEVIVSLVNKFGRNVVLDFFWETQKKRRVRWAHYHEWSKEEEFSRSSLQPAQGD